ncbi:MAG: BREX-1 system phosphatase PglZ type A [Proteobacteria bacterium]|nr:BREX-1 system phosphatase PglZ type A [Pseudomonadota bacterium]MBU1686354.1 BREX-1 system phosphatase PglZ type A [Pseudomonadota bacterium]
MSERIAQALSRLFDKHRIVFWHDADKELRADFEALHLPDITKVELNNNEFAVKHRILRELPEQKFLLYREGPQPADLDNWLLDVQLAHGEFQTDQAALHLSELELPLEFAELVRQHLDFFTAAKRREALKKLLKPDDQPRQIRLKILAVCAGPGAEARLDSILEFLLAELAEDREEKIKLIGRCGLDKYLWEQTERLYGYESKTPGIRDFAIELFKSCYRMELGESSLLNSEALVFLKRWKDSIRHRATFEKLSDDCADVLGIEKDLQQRDYRQLLDLDFFRLIEQKIISDLVNSLASRTLAAGECATLIRARRQSHWHQGYSDIYEAIDYAARIFSELETVHLQIDSLADGVERYVANWYRIDQLYRKFVFHARQSGEPSLLGKLITMVEDLYTNNYLRRVNDKWQEQVDLCVEWRSAGVVRQDGFFRKWVAPFLKEQKKVSVIISDALRYEIGEELVSLIRREDRYDAVVAPMLTLLPSYTQLGMAALLPHQTLSFAPNDTGAVLVDGVSSQGTPNRCKILAQGIKARGAVVKADELLAMDKDGCRTLFRDHDVVYIYHNRIDATGDDRKTEEQVFGAVEEALAELIKVVKKLTAANATNLLVTADHGFIYQNRPIPESDFTDIEAKDELVLYRDRRFLLGKGINEHASLKKFSSQAVGLTGEMEIQLPKSINRLRLQGSGSRYVHGGAALQEVVVPVVSINKKRRSDTGKVEVEILQSGNQLISSGQLAVAFYQTLPVSSKIQPRILRAGIYDQGDQLISDSQTLNFDSVSENPRDREFKVRFVMSRKADEANNQDVNLKLEEQLPGTSHFREYKSLRYTLRRSFTSDFEL